MQNFFGIKLRITGVLLVLAGFLLTHLPQHDAVQQHNSFSNWVMQHLSEHPSGENQAAERNENLRSKLQQVMSGNVTDGQQRENPGDKSRIIPILYLAWSQHQDASDMAGTFSHDRISLQLILKHHAAMLSGLLFNASGSETYPSFFQKKSAKLRDFHRFGLIALVSGQSVNAP